ncbi:hypothetical protein LZ31DRAFT_31027 [Colletotrichum somersetense]|nr:hypothetical protein LZ31DRAFT_31027 [Colletotrichum somersetense]
MVTRRGRSPCSAAILGPLSQAAVHGMGLGPVFQLKSPMTLGFGLHPESSYCSSSSFFVKPIALSVTGYYQINRPFFLGLVPSRSLADAMLSARLYQENTAIRLSLHAYQGNLCTEILLVQL